MVGLPGPLEESRQAGSSRVPGRLGLLGVPSTRVTASGGGKLQPFAHIVPLGREGQSCLSILGAPGGSWNMMARGSCKQYARILHQARATGEVGEENL